MHFNNSLLVIGGGTWNSARNLMIFGATVEEFNKPAWTERTQMTPVNKLNGLGYFSVISMKDNLYIFGLFHLKKHN